MKHSRSDMYVHGTVFGILLCCILMLLFPKHKTCEVDFGDVNHTHVRYGVWNDEPT